jgi:hypothetical protein
LSFDADGCDGQTFGAFSRKDRGRGWFVIKGEPGRSPESCPIIPIVKSLQRDNFLGAVGIGF